MAKAYRDAKRIAGAVTQGWLSVQALESGRLNEPLMPSLGLGESEAIALALAAPKETLLILDDRLARRYALKRGLALIGTVRVLALAERRGLIDNAAHCIDGMAANGYRISRELLDMIFH